MNCVPPMEQSGKCPVCGMDLIPTRLEAPARESGFSNIKLSQEAIRLGSIQVAPVERKSVTAEVRLFGKIDYDPAHVSYIAAFMPGVILAVKEIVKSRRFIYGLDNLLGL